MKFCVFSDKFHFPRLFPLFEMISCHCSFLGFALIDAISGCLLFARSCISKMPAALFKGISDAKAQFPGSQLPGWQTICLSVLFNRHFLLFSNILLLIRLLIMAAHITILFLSLHIYSVQILNFAQYLSECESIYSPKTYPCMVLEADFSAALQIQHR